LKEKDIKNLQLKNWKRRLKRVIFKDNQREITARWLYSRSFKSKIHSKEGNYKNLSIDLMIWK